MNASLIAISVLVAAPAPKTAPKAEPPSIVGLWVVESDIHGGKPEAVPEGTTISFDKDGTAFVKEGKDDAGNKMNYTLDPAQDPGRLDLIEAEAMGNPQKFSGIYKIDGDTLTICVDMNGNRPGTFASPVGSMNILLTLKRAKKE